jgi:hypothetical protein
MRAELSAQDDGNSCSRRYRDSLEGWLVRSENLVDTSLLWLSDISPLLSCSMSREGYDEYTVYGVGTGRVRLKDGVSINIFHSNARPV